MSLENYNQKLHPQPPGNLLWKALLSNLPPKIIKTGHPAASDSAKCQQSEHPNPTSPTKPHPSRAQAQPLPIAPDPGQF